MDAFADLRQRHGPAVLAGAGPGAVISGTAEETAIIPTVTIPNGIMTADGQMVQIEWDGQILQNVDNNQTLGFALMINGAAALRSYTAAFNTATNLRLMRIRGKLIRASATKAWSMLSIYMNAQHKTLTGDEVGVGTLASAASLSERSIAADPAGITCDWAQPVTLSVALKMLTASANFTQQTLHWRMLAR